MPPDRTEKERKHQPRTWVAPVNRKPRAKKVDKPRTSAKLIAGKERHENLTAYDWLQVFAFVEKNPTMSQTRVVEYFKTRPEGALIFTQATLSRRLKARDTLLGPICHHKK